MNVPEVSTKKENSKTRVAIFGGSFDPPTIAHMQVACEIYNNFEHIDQVWIVPCGDGRCDKKLKTPAHHRLNMLHLIKDDLIAPNVPIFIDETEINRGEYIPTYYLLKELAESHKDKEFVFCIGTDLLGGLKNWDQGEKLVEEFEFIIISREDYPIVLDRPDVLYPKKYETLNTIISGSSTKIRNRIYSRIETKLNLAINGLTTNRVIKYIQENKLYSIE